jgi:hypothetical protein
MPTDDWWHFSTPHEPLSACAPMPARRRAAASARRWQRGDGRLRGCERRRAAVNAIVQMGY